MKFYLAGRYGRREELADTAAWIEANHGWESTARWLAGDGAAQVRCPGCQGHGCAQCGWCGDDAEQHDDAPRWAVECIQDITRADALILFTEQPGADGAGRGGRHVEFGYALASQKLVVVVGPRENVFCHLAHHCETVRGAVAWIEGVSRVG